MTLPDPIEQPTMRVEEAAQVLGISRPVAYAAAQEYVRTDGESGLPVIRLGERRLLVPTAQVWRLLGLDHPAIRTGDGRPNLAVLDGGLS